MIEVSKEDFYKYVMDSSFIVPNDIVMQHGCYKRNEKDELVQGLTFKHRGSNRVIGEVITTYQSEGVDVYKLTESALEHLRQGAK